MSATDRSLVIKVTAGVEAAERCSQAFTVAATAIASAVPVSLWLTGESTWFAVPGRVPAFDLPHAVPPDQLLAAVVEGGGQVVVCSQCAARRSLTEADLSPGVRIAGAAGFVEQITAPGVQALVY